MDAIRAEEDEIRNLDLPIIMAPAEGKKTFEEGPPEKQTEIVLELINNWRVQFEARGGPGWTLCRITGGTLIAPTHPSTIPIAPTSYVQVVMINAHAGTLIGSEDMQLQLDVIQERTDRLPDDPADESLLETAIASRAAAGEAAAALASYDPPTRTEATADKDEILGVVALDSTVAKQVELLDVQTKVSGLAADWADGGRLDLILDNILSKVDTEIADIKAKTDALPADPASETTLTALQAIAQWLRDVQEGAKKHVDEGAGGLFFEVRHKTTNNVLLRHLEKDRIGNKPKLTGAAPVEVGGNLV